MKIFQSLKYRAIWYKKLFFYLQAGQSVSDAVKVSAGKDTDLNFLATELSTGKRMSKIYLDDFTDTVSGLELSLVDAAEKTGSLQEIFLTLSNLLKIQVKQKQKLVSAAIYPIIVLCMAGLLLLLILLIIVPKIGPLFSDMPHLPRMTKILIGSSEHAVSNWWIDLLLIIVAVGAHMFFRSKDSYRKLISKIKKSIFSKTPYIKEIYYFWHIEKWLYIITICLESKMPLHASVALASSSTGDTYMKEQFLQMSKTIEDGKTFSDAISMLSPRLYTKLADWQSIIKGGEKTGNLLEVLKVCHEQISGELNEAFDRAQKMIEPALIILIGLMVMCICISIILPMYQLTQSLNT